MSEHAPYIAANPSDNFAAVVKLPCGSSVSQSVTAEWNTREVILAIDFRDKN